MAIVQMSLSSTDSSPKTQLQRHHMLPPRMWVAKEKQQNHHDKATTHPLPAHKWLLFSGRTWTHLFRLWTGGTTWV